MKHLLLNTILLITCIYPARIFFQIDNLKYIACSCFLYKQCGAQICCMHRLNHWPFNACSKLGLKFFKNSGSGRFSGNHQAQETAIWCCKGYNARSLQKEAWVMVRKTCKSLGVYCVWDTCKYIKCKSSTLNIKYLNIKY